MKITAGRGPGKSNKGGFTIKPTSVNHFTGKKLPSLEDNSITDPQASREDLRNSKTHLISESQDLLYVQLGDKTQVFGFGQQE